MGYFMFVMSIEDMNTVPVLCIIHELKFSPFQFLVRILTQDFCSLLCHNDNRSPYVHKKDMLYVINVLYVVGNIRA